MPTTADTHYARGSYRVAVYDPDDLADRYPGWYRLDKHAKLARILATPAKHRVAPARTARGENTTCVALDRHVAYSLSPAHPHEDYADVIALGVADPLSVDHTDEALAAEVHRTDIVNYDIRGTPEDELICNAFLAQEEAAGQDLTELGIVTDNDALLNHAEIDPALEKSAIEEATIEVRLQFTTDPADD